MRGDYTNSTRHLIFSIVSDYNYKSLGVDIDISTLSLKMTCYLDRLTEASSHG